MTSGAVGSKTAAADACKAWSIRPLTKYWWQGHRFFNPFRSGMDTLHVLDAGIFKKLLKWMVRLVYAYTDNDRAGKAICVELDRRMASMPRFRNLRVFGRGISSCAQFCGFEYRHMMPQLLCAVHNLSPEVPDLAPLLRAWLTFYYAVKTPEPTDAVLRSMRESYNR